MMELAAGNRLISEHLSVSQAIAFVEIGVGEKGFGADA
jgi:hypothetical protein